MTYAMRLIPIVVFAMIVVAAAVAETAEQCKAFSPVPAASRDRDVNAKISNTAVLKFIKFAGESVKVENTYDFVRRSVRVRMSDSDKATYEEDEFRLSIWRQVLLMQCVLLAESTRLSDAEKTNAIVNLLPKRSLERPPLLR